MDEKPQGIRFRTVIEMAGKPKEHIEKTLKVYVEKVREDHDFILLKESFAEPKQIESMWSTFAELEIVCKDIPKMIGFCFEYMPASIEILKPDNFNMENHEITGFLNDLQARLHNVDMIVKRLRAENDVLRKNMSLTIENIITILLKINAMSIEEISKYSGINRDELAAFLNNMINDAKVKVDDERYRLVKNE